MQREERGRRRRGGEEREAEEESQVVPKQRLIKATLAFENRCFF